MSGPRPGEVKWDVASPELLRTISTAPLPCGLRAAPSSRSFHRDIYYDTADGALARRNMTARFRIGADTSGDESHRGRSLRHLRRHGHVVRHANLGRPCERQNHQFHFER